MKFPIPTSVKEGSFIHEYIQDMERYETAKSYDYFGALWCIGVVLGRSAYVDRPGIPVYLNLYSILCAESGVTRKSTAVKLARNLIKQFQAQQTDHQTLIIESKMTPEMLEFTLQGQSNDHGYAHAAIVISELVTFLGREKYAMHMPGLLTDLYDSPSLRAGGGTISRGTTSIRNIYVSFFTASTPSWLLRAINPDVVEGGFTSRCLFVHDEQPKTLIAWPDRKLVERKSRALQLLIALSRNFTSSDNGSRSLHLFSLESRALDTFDVWYRTRTIHKDPFQASFESREDDHILRISALIAANNGSLIITHENIQDATAIVLWAKTSAATIFAYTGNSPLVIAVDKLRVILVDAGVVGISQTDLMRKMQQAIPAEQVRTTLDVMHELDMVQRFEQKTGRRGKLTTRWRATKYINGVDAVQMVINHWENIE